MNVFMLMESEANVLSINLSSLYISLFRARGALKALVSFITMQNAKKKKHIEEGLVGAFFFEGKARESK